MQPLLNQFYPEHTITVTSHDPNYMTPELKAKLYRKNKLMHALLVASRKLVPRRSKLVKTSPSAIRSGCVKLTAKVIQKVCGLLLDHSLDANDRHLTLLA